MPTTIFYDIQCILFIHSYADKNEQVCNEYNDQVCVVYHNLYGDKLYTGTVHARVRASCIYWPSLQMCAYKSRGMQRSSCYPNYCLTKKRIGFEVWVDHCYTTGISRILYIYEKEKGLHAICGGILVERTRRHLFRCYLD